MVAAIVLVLRPPDRRQTIDGCTPTTDVSCTASMDGDANVFAGILASLGGIALVLAVLGIRFSTVKALGTELAQPPFPGLPHVSGQEEGLAESGAATRVPAETAVETPDLLTEHAEHEQRLVTRLPSPMREEPLGRRSAQPLSRRRVQTASTHVPVAPAEQGDTAWPAVPRCHLRRRSQDPVTPDTVKSAVMFFGEAWNSKFFDAEWGDDGRLGVVTEAHGPFLALCEVTLSNDERILLHHYVDFPFGPLIA